MGRPARRDTSFAAKVPAVGAGPGALDAAAGFGVGLPRAAEEHQDRDEQHSCAHQARRPPEQRKAHDREEGVAGANRGGSASLNDS